MKIRGLSGLGDAFFLYSFAKHLSKNNNLIVYSNYKDVFFDIPNIEIKPYSVSEKYDYVFSYLSRKSQPTNMFEDICISSNLKVEYKKEHKIQNKELINTIKQKNILNKQICIISVPDNVMGNSPAGKHIKWDNNIFQNIINKYKDKYFFIQIGNSNVQFNNIDFDLKNKTSIIDLYDLVYISNLSLGIVGFIIHLSELLDKKVIGIIPQQFKTDKNTFFNTLTPNKYMSKKTTFVVYENEIEKIYNFMEDI